VAESKLMQYLESALFYLNNKKVKIFVSFLKLENAFEKEDFDFFINLISFISKDNLAHSLPTYI
jgi:hypothetical protein